MDMFEMLEAIKKIPLQQLQERGNGFFGAVIDKDALKPVRGILDTFFGQPLKAESAEVTPEMHNISSPYGGIRENQTLYYKKHGSDRVLAMLWPWSDNSRVTLKVIREF